MNKDRIILPDPEEIEQQDIVPVMAQMAAIQMSLATRLVADGADREQEDGETLLTVEEAAARLKCSERVGRNLRFSERGIDEAIRSGMRFA